MTNLKHTIYPTCALCGQVPAGGLHDGLRIMGSFICSQCESQLIHLDESDPRYAHYVALLQDAFHKPLQQAISRYTQI